jgi:glutamate N-acetyltransferase/amino-acid N-acetyltransferase
MEINAMTETTLHWMQDGGVTAPQGYRAGAVCCGIKANRKRDDLALLVADIPAAAAGVFTRNRVKAAPVLLCRQHLHAQRAQAIVINAGNANACTGRQGRADAQTTARLVAKNLGLAPELVLVCSTGTIGIPLPMDKLAAGIPRVVAALQPRGGAIAAQAILTTDTVAKQAGVEMTIDGHLVTIGGMAKGSGMIAPDMATMMAFLTTDAVVAPAALQGCLRQAVAASFNRISVDGDQSTNDTVLLLANGRAGNKILDENHIQWGLFCEAVHAVAHDLALKIVKDGEGATKFVTLTVRGAADTKDARKAARTVGGSLLVKTSWFGGDPNWGRVMDALGYSGAMFEEDQVEIRYNDCVAVRNGQAATATALQDLEQILKEKEFTLTIDLHRGPADYTLYTCDCSIDYVKINSEYMT